MEILKLKVMKKEALIFGIEHEFLLKEFISFATMEFGSLKMNEIIKNVNTSGKVAKFLFEAKRISLRLGSDDFLGCIHSSTRFVFSKAETISIAAIAILMKWNHDAGDPCFLSDEIYLNTIFFSILDKCDGFKTHVGSIPNFFERFYNHLERIVKLRVLKSNTPVVKTEISFDSVLCDAIRSGEKTEFRVNDNLEGINFEPDEWRFEGYDVEKGAKFFCAFLGEFILVEYPYRFRSIIKVFDVTNPLIVHSEIMITSFRIQRIRDVNQDDAKREGFGAYKEKIEELFIKDPSLDAELCLFQDDWIVKYGQGTFVNNGWLWIFEFKINQEIQSGVQARATSSGLTAEGLKALLEVAF